MTGYLDQGFGAGFGANRGSFRQVIDRVLAAGTAPDRKVYGFGSRISPVNAPGNQDIIRRLVERSFYSDGNTRLEDVLDSVAADGKRAAAHLIVTDGRRGDGADAIAQYRRMGELASQWAQDSGSFFAIAALNAPFMPVKNDRAGCSSDEGEDRITCPLYLVVFAPRAHAEEILSRLRETGASVFAAPAFSDDKVSIHVRPRVPNAGLHVFDGGGSRPRALFQAPSKYDTVAVTVVAQLREGAGRFALGDSLGWRLRQSPVTAASTPGSWSAVQQATTSWVMPRDASVDHDAATVSIPVLIRAQPQIQPTRYVLELVATGRPSWLAQFESAQQGDAVRTYGLSSLFNQLKREETSLASAVITVY